MRYRQHDGEGSYPGGNKEPKCSIHRQDEEEGRKRDKRRQSSQCERGEKLAERITQDLEASGKAIIGWGGAPKGNSLTTSEVLWVDGSQKGGRKKGGRLIQA